MKLPVLAAAILTLTFSSTALSRDTKHLLSLEKACSWVFLSAMIAMQVA